MQFSQLNVPNQVSLDFSKNSPASLIVKIRPQKEENRILLLPRNKKRRRKMRKKKKRKSSQKARPSRLENNLTSINIHSIGISRKKTDSPPIPKTLPTTHPKERTI